MRQKTIKDVVTRQIQGVTNNAAKIKAGIDAVVKSPGVAAAEQIDVMVQNFLAAISDGSTEAALRNIDLAEWKRQALDGVSRIGPGMERKREVIEAFHDQLQEYQLSYTRQIDGMPKGTLAASRDRMLENFDRMAEFQFKKP